MQVSSLAQQQDWNVLEQLRSRIGGSGGAQVGGEKKQAGSTGSKVLPHISSLLSGAGSGSGGGGGAGGSGTFRASSKRTRNVPATTTPTPFLYPNPYPHLPPLNPKIFPTDQPPAHKRQRTMSEETASPAAATPAPRK